MSIPLVVVFLIRFGRIEGGETRRESINEGVVEMEVD